MPGHRGHLVDREDRLPSVQMHAAVDIPRHDHELGVPVEPIRHVPPRQVNLCRTLPRPTASPHQLKFDVILAGQLTRTHRGRAAQRPGALSSDLRVYQYFSVELQVKYQREIQ